MTIDNTPGLTKELSCLICISLSTCATLIQLWFMSPTPSLCTLSKQQACNLVYFSMAWLSPQHALPPMLTHEKHQLQREPCSLFMQALYLSSWVAMYVIYIFHTYLCYLIYVMLLLYFRPVTEKKTLLLRNHSICSGPQRFTFVFDYSALLNIHFQWVSPHKPVSD